MPSPFPSSPVIRECSRKKTQIERIVSIGQINIILIKNSEWFLTGSIFHNIYAFAFSSGLWNVPSKSEHTVLLAFS